MLFNCWDISSKVFIAPLVYGYRIHLPITYLLKQKNQSDNNVVDEVNIANYRYRENFGENIFVVVIYVLKNQ